MSKIIFGILTILLLVTTTTLFIMSIWLENIKFAQTGGILLILLVLIAVIFVIEIFER